MVTVIKNNMWCVFCPPLLDLWNCSDIYFIIYILGPLITDCEMRIGF